MLKPTIPYNEKERQKELASYSILDTLPEEDYDNLTAIASEICGTDIALVSLIDDKRQWFKSHHGLDAEETPKEVAFCAHAINKPDEVFIIQDARKDHRFSDNPLVTHDPYVIFYAGVPLLSENGLPLGTLCVIDNTPKLLSQSQIKSLKALTKQVMNLLELRRTKSELEKALEKTKEKNRDLEQFAALAAHDLKSPLNNISILSKFLLDDYSTNMEKQGVEMIELIQNSANKLKSLIDGLLDYNRSDKILKEQIATINLEILKKDIEGLFIVDNKCSITLHTELKEISANRAALEQIMINLVANAIKYNDKELSKIDLVVSEQNDKYEFSVQDNGPGIAPEYQERIFQLYEILQPKDKFGQSGNGIGLATVKKMVEAQGGSIGVDSKIGQGAKFTFTIEK